eukprot:5514298-Ditylum_brightwellii.AAC.1
MGILEGAVLVACLLEVPTHAGRFLGSSVPRGWFDMAFQDAWVDDCAVLFLGQQPRLVALRVEDSVYVSLG